MKFHFFSSRGEIKNNFSSRISRDRDSCQGLVQIEAKTKDYETLILGRELPKHHPWTCRCTPCPLKLDTEKPDDL